MKAGTGAAAVAVLALLGAHAAHAGVSFNTIDGHATYTQGGALVRSSGPIGCTRGERIAIRLSVRQAATGAQARGRWRTRCSGEVQHWRMRARAQRGARFANGKARVCALATTRSGPRITDTRRWCRRVPLSASFSTANPDAALAAAPLTDKESR